MWSSDSRRKNIHFIQRLKLSKNMIYGAVANKKIRTDCKCANVQSKAFTHGMVSIGNQRLFAAHFFTSKGFPTHLQEAGGTLCFRCVDVNVFGIFMILFKFLMSLLIYRCILKNRMSWKSSFISVIQLKL